MRISTSLILAIATALAGCAFSGSKEATIPSDGPTMSEVYKQHMSSSAADSTAWRERLPLREPDDPSLTPYTRTAADEIENRFTRLPNPDLVMYVTPHLAGAGRYPVPGYTTAFPMYESVEYAMPGEVAPARRSPSSAARR
jgi:conjugative transfer region lipoprotein (TIGR03751 family)